MPWCPNCGVEYRQGFNTCGDCNVELVTELEPVVENSDNVDDYDHAGESHLISVTNPFEAEMIESLLVANKIPVLKKLNQAGGFLDIYMGTAAFGVDLYVPSKLLEKARDIVENSRELVTDNDNKMFYDYQSYRNNKNKRRIRVWIIILFFIPGLFWIAINNVILYLFEHD